jgi:D-alanine-D-alanine ligase
MERKLRIGIIFGGRSGEHEVSVASARSVMGAIDQSRYEIVPIAITREGRWMTNVEPTALLAPTEAPHATLQEEISSSPTKYSGATAVDVVTQGQENGLPPVDIIFTTLHGTNGEDGALQGMLEMAGIPYVGCGILGSALGMDKEKAKIIFQAAGLPVVPWITVLRRDIDRDPDTIVAQVEDRFSYPVFIKPVNLGSSVGISKAHDANELRAALSFAARYDRRVLIEDAIDCREIECAVLGNDDPEASIVGEIVPSKEFYDYEAKYLDSNSRLMIPAPINEELSNEIRRMAVSAFLSLDLSGLARVDFFLDRTTNAIYLNEVNTLPGFTEISMYPKLWAATGLPYPQLIDRLIELGLERAADRSRNATDAGFAQ